MENNLKILMKCKSLLCTPGTNTMYFNKKIFFDEYNYI